MNSVTLPESLTKISANTFSNCSSLLSITIPNGVTSIGNYAFSNCTILESVSIPESVTSIGNFAFLDCPKLYKAYFASIASMCRIQYLTSQSNPLCNNDENIDKYLYVEGKAVTDVDIPEGITEIGKYTFYRFSNIKSVTIPSSVTNIGTSAFYGCTGLTNVTCKAQGIPETISSSFQYVPYDEATLYVPKSALEDYKNSSPWYNFGNIQGVNMGGGIVGDANGNGKIEIGDITAILTIMATGGE